MKATVSRIDNNGGRGRRHTASGGPISATTTLASESAICRGRYQSLQAHPAEHSYKRSYTRQQTSISSQLLSTTWQLSKPATNFLTASSSGTLPRTHLELPMPQQRDLQYHQLRPLDARQCGAHFLVSQPSRTSPVMNLMEGVPTQARPLHRVMLTILAAYRHRMMLPRSGRIRR